ncbi:MAG: DUF1442 domain-containing protein [Lautropia sp.]|nr:DUF1442 domain-containing protein [Lautropia sp.]
MDQAIFDVMEQYHARIHAERNTFPIAAPPGGRDGGHDQRMRAIGPETGQLLNLLVRSLQKPLVLEIGTSFGYSTIWLAEAARATGGKLITLEKHAYKSDYARTMAEKAGLSAHVEFRVGDALDLIPALSQQVDFVFVDLWKDLYAPCLTAFLPHLKPGAMIVADNMLSHDGAETRAYADALRARPEIDTVLLPMGSGLELSRYMPTTDAMPHAMTGQTAA